MKQRIGYHCWDVKSSWLPGDHTVFPGYNSTRIVVGGAVDASRVILFRFFLDEARKSEKPVDGRIIMTDYANLTFSASYFYLNP